MRKLLLTTLAISALTMPVTGTEYAKVSNTDTRINCQEIKLTPFEAKLKKTNSYKAPNYNIQNYDGLGTDAALINSVMGGMMNSMMMSNGTNNLNNIYAAEMMKKQQEEYTRQQLENAKRMELEENENARSPLNPYEMEK